VLDNLRSSTFAQPAVLLNSLTDLPLFHSHYYTPSFSSLK
jgi:hypothetical protein